MPEVTLLISGQAVITHRNQVGTYKGFAAIWSNLQSEGPSKESYITFFSFYISLVSQRVLLRIIYSSCFKSAALHTDAALKMQTVPLPSVLFAVSWEIHRSKMVFVVRPSMLWSRHGPCRGESHRTKKLFMLRSIIKHTHHTRVQCKETTWSTIISEKGLWDRTLAPSEPLQASWAQPNYLLLNKIFICPSILVQSVVISFLVTPGAASRQHDSTGP